MEKYQMSRSGCRPYNRTCGMARPADMARQPNMSERMTSPMDRQDRDAGMYSHLQHLEAAMAYVPCQAFTTTFDLDYALRVGTVFPELCRPFCGKRGGRK